MNVCNIKKLLLVTTRYQDLAIINNPIDISLIRSQLNFQSFRSNLVLNNIHVSPLMGDAKIYRLAITEASYLDFARTTIISQQMRNNSGDWL